MSRVETAGGEMMMTFARETPEVAPIRRKKLRGLLATLAFRRGLCIAGHECWVDVLEHDLFGDDDLRDVLTRRDVVHDREKHLFEDGAQSTRAGAAKDGLVGNSLERVARELELDVVELEQLLVLTDERVLRLGEDPDQRLAVEVVDAGDDRQPPDELGDHAVLQQVLRHDVAEHVSRVDVGLAAHGGAEADALLADPRLDHLVETRERTAHDEQHVGRVDLDELLVRVLATTLRRHGRGGAFEDLQQRLLHAFTGDVTRDRRVLALAGDLVDLVDVDDAGLGLLDVVVSGLDQLEQDVLDVLADITGLGERCRVRDREGDVEHLREGLRQQRLAAAGRAEQHDVGLLQLDRVLVAGAGLDPLVVVVDGDRQRLLRVVLPDHIAVEELVDLFRLGQLVELDVGAFGQLLFDDLVAQVDALVADVDAGACDEFLDLLLALPAEGALEQVATVTDACHSISSGG